MKKIILMISLAVCTFVSSVTYANWYLDIINAINNQGGIESGFLSSINSQQSALLTSQQNVEKAIQQMNGSLIGNFGWGTYNAHDYQSYGSTATDWNKVLQLAENGGGSGDLGQKMNTVAGQFPIDEKSYNQGIADPNSQKFYSLQSQTVLATRSASQLDYDKIQDQITYQQMLQQQIEKATDLKSAVDLNNRIQVESNLINLEILRQSALSNQQSAISQQANVNSALLNAKFLTKQ